MKIKFKYKTNEIYFINNAIHYVSKCLLNTYLTYYRILRSVIGNDTDNHFNKFL